jgi:N-methylhydantoinase A
MGGTTAKLCLIDNFAPMTARAFEVDRSYRFRKGSGLPVRIPVIEMVEIGAGGGSIAHVDALVRLQVGPESAGSEPGPALYNRGGARPTVTDADAVMGKIALERFAGGSISLDLEKAKRAVVNNVGKTLGFERASAAFAISEIVDENMAAAARAHAIEWGKDVSARAMIAFGGAAPLHAARLAEKLGVDTVVVPANAGVGSAVGFLLAPAAFEVVRSRHMRLEEFDFEAIEDLFGEMRAESEGVVRGAVGSAPLTERRHAYMRYDGQGHEIAVVLPNAAFSNRSGADLRCAFEDVYAGLYGRTIPDMAIEVLTWSLTLAGPQPSIEPLKSLGTARSLEPPAHRDVFDASLGETAAYGMFERALLPTGTRIAGPALIVEDQTTTVVTSAFDAHVDSAENLVLARRRP